MYECVSTWSTQRLDSVGWMKRSLQQRYCLWAFTKTPLGSRLFVREFIEKIDLYLVLQKLRVHICIFRFKMHRKSIFRWHSQNMIRWLQKTMRDFSLKSLWKSARYKNLSWLLFSIMCVCTRTYHIRINVHLYVIYSRVLFRITRVVVWYKCAHFASITIPD